MALKTYIWGIVIITLLSSLAFWGVVNYMDPGKSGFPGKVIFYSVLFFSLGGLFNLFLLLARKRMLGGEGTLANIGLSLRQGFLLALLSIGILILQGMRMLIWWDGLLLVAGVFLIELYFLSKE